MSDDTCRGGNERFERFHDDDLDVAARRDLRTGDVQVLVMTGYHHCGHSKTYLASSAKLPADEGGWYETSQCDGCLGTMEMREEWWPKEDVVS